MRCHKMRKKVLRYLDGELSERESREFHAHLRSCRSCQDDVKAIESFWRIERPVERMTAPPFLWSRISARLASQEKGGIVNKLKDLAAPILRPALLLIIWFLSIIGGNELGKVIISPAYERTGMQTGEDFFGMSHFEILPPGSLNAQTLELIESEMQK